MTRDISIIVLIALVLFVPPLFTRDVWFPDGVRYMQVAQEMVVHGEYIVPHLNGEVYTGKPPFHPWLSTLFYRAGFGVDSGRLVAACMGLGIMLLVYVFFQALFGRAGEEEKIGSSSLGGVLAAAIVGTTFLLHDVTMQGVIDPLLTFMTTTAFMAAYFALRKKTRHRRLWWLLFYGAAALAVLAKGPVGIAMPGCVVLAYALLNRRHIAREGWWIHAAGMALFLGLLCAWLIPAYFRGGESYIRSIIFDEQALYTVDASSHVRGPHYYLMKLPFHLVPWFFFGALGTAQCMAAWRKQGDRRAAFLAVWFLGVLAFFTIVPSKRGRYLMPLVPALGLISARYLVMAAKERPRWPKLHKACAMVTFWPPAFAALLLLPATPIALSLGTWIFSNASPAFREIAGRSATPVNMLIVLATALAVLWTSLTAYRLMVRSVSIKAPGLKCEEIRPSTMGTPVHAALLLAALVLLASILNALLVHPTIHPTRLRDFFATQVRPSIERADTCHLYGGKFSDVVNLYMQGERFPVIEARDEEQMKQALIQVLESPQKVTAITDHKKFRAVKEELPAGVNMPAHRQIGHSDLIVLRNWGDGISVEE